MTEAAEDDDRGGYRAEETADRNGSTGEGSTGDGSAGDERRRHPAVVDRFEGDLAVLVVEKDEETTELVLDSETLSPGGRELDTVHRVTYADSEVVDVEHAAAESEARRSEIRRSETGSVTRR